MNSLFDDAGKRSGKGTIYFLQIGEDGPIKIGVTGLDPTKRIASLRSFMPYHVEVLGIIPNVNRQAELFIHGMFSKYRMNGEWFLPDEELKLFIRVHCKLYREGDSLEFPQKELERRQEEYSFLGTDREQVLIRARAIYLRFIGGRKHYFTRKMKKAGFSDQEANDITRSQYTMPSLIHLTPSDRLAVAKTYYTKIIRLARENVWKQMISQGIPRIKIAKVTKFSREQIWRATKKVDLGKYPINADFTTEFTKISFKSITRPPKARQRQQKESREAAILREQATQEESK